MQIIYVYGNKQEVLNAWAKTFSDRKLLFNVKKGYYSKGRLEMDYFPNNISGLIINEEDLTDYVNYMSFKDSVTNEYFIAHTPSGNTLVFNPLYVYILSEKSDNKFLYGKLKPYINQEYCLSNKSFIV